MARATEATVKAEEDKFQLVEAAKAHANEVKKLIDSFTTEKEKVIEEHRSQLRALLENHINVMKNAKEQHNTDLALIQEKSFKKTETALRRCFRLTFLNAD